MNSFAQFQRTYNKLQENEEFVAYFNDNACLDLGEILKRVCSSSPYLATCLEKETNWICSSFCNSFDNTLEKLMELSEGLRHKKNLKEISTQLRIFKRRFSLIIALADISKIWSLEEITSKLTIFADLSLSIAFDVVAQEVANDRKHKLLFKKFQSAGKIKSADLGFIVIAMGKMGAFELNYSSDIDFNVFYDISLYNKDERSSCIPILIKITKSVISFMSDVQAEGYIFRSDLRLRPEPSVTSVCLSTKFALGYYEEKGRTWERSAYIKARPVAGDIIKGWKFLENLKPFIWREKLNFFAIQDTQEIRRKIALKLENSGQNSFFGFDLKVGTGGIRDIELYTQTLQLIHGAKSNKVRGSGTCQTLVELFNEGWIEETVKEQLIEAYRFYRNVEHRIQMINDTQSHQLPKTQKASMAISELMLLTLEQLFSMLKTHQKNVIKICDHFFSGFGELSTGSSEKLSLPKDIFQDLNIIAVHKEKWKNYNIFKSERACKLFANIESDFFSMVATTAFPKETIVVIDHYFSQLPSGIEIFSLLNTDKLLLRVFIDLASKAPQVLDEIGQNTDILASVMQKNFFDNLPGLHCVHKFLESSLSKKTFDYEQKLNVIRQLAKELKFKVAVHLLQRRCSIEQASLCYSLIAQAILQVLTPIVMDNFSKRYGQLREKGIAIIGMGKLGSQEMTFTSDLDLIIVYDPKSYENEKSFSTIHQSTYFSRLTKELVSSLTAPMKNGYLYKVDMRLRPSGSKGPVAVSFSSFSNYQINEAWTWEHLALVRARVVFGDLNFSAQVQKIIGRALNTQRDISKIVEDVKAMRVKLSENFKLEQRKIKSLNIKAGLGMMQDLELLVKMGSLITKQKNGENIFDLIVQLKKNNYFTASEAKILNDAWRTYYYCDFLSRFFSFSISYDANFDDKSWESLLNKEGFLTVISELLLDNFSRKESASYLNSRVHSLSNKVNAIFEKKLCLE